MIYYKDMNNEYENLDAPTRLSCWIVGLSPVVMVILIVYGWITG